MYHKQISWDSEILAPEHTISLLCPDLKMPEMSNVFDLLASDAEPSLNSYGHVPAYFCQLNDHRERLVHLHSRLGR